MHRPYEIFQTPLINVFQVTRDVHRQNRFMLNDIIACRYLLSRSLSAYTWVYISVRLKYAIEILLLKLLLAKFSNPAIFSLILEVIAALFMHHKTIEAIHRNPNSLPSLSSLLNWQYMAHSAGDPTCSSNNAEHTEMTQMLLNWLYRQQTRWHATLTEPFP